MSRTRMFGTIAAVVACAGFVAGCGGGGGYTAAENPPTSTAPAPTPAAAAPAAGAPATPGAQSVVGTFAPSDPATSRDQTFAGYTRFPKTRAGKIFVGPAPTAPDSTSTTASTPPADSPVTTIPLAPTIPSTTPGTTAPTPAPVTTKLTASLDVSGTVETVVIGNQVPAASPLFTVQDITASSVTLKINSGTLPDGTTTVKLALNTPVTLSNAAYGTNLTIKVLEIKSQVA